MIPQPVVLGLTLCDKIIIEAESRNISLIDCFTKIRVDSFPSLPQRICMFAALTGGHGEGTIELVVKHAGTDEVVASGRRKIQFRDRLTRVRMMVRLKQISFRAPGAYEVTLSLDGEWLTATVLRVDEKERT